MIALAALAPAWWLARKLKSAWDIAHLPVIILHGSDGLEVHIRPLGCAIQRLLAPDNTGNLEDIVLGFDDVKEYAVSRQRRKSVEHCKVALLCVVARLSANSCNLAIQASWPS